MRSSVRDSDGKLEKQEEQMAEWPTLLTWQLGLFMQFAD